jgi:hypothetical protein
VKRAGPNPAAAPGRPTKVSRKQVSEARRQLAAGGLSHDERRRLHSVTQAWDAGHSRHRAGRRFVIVAGGTLAVMAVVGAALGLIPAIQAASGRGTPGTFIVGAPACASTRGGCVWSGTFQQQDGSAIQHVSYGGTLPASAGPGSSIPAVQPDGSHIVYPPHGSHQWISDLLIMLLAGCVVGFGLWASPLGLGRRDRVAAGTV